MRFFSWQKVASDSPVVAPDQRLAWPKTGVMGVQHLVAMFGSTVLAPILMGFDPNVAVLMSGVGTLVFFLVTAGKVPSYLGSSFAFIGVVIAATGHAGSGPNPQIGIALGGIVLCGLAYALIGVAVHVAGTRWIEALMPPVVTGAVVCSIGLNLAYIPVKNMSAGPFDAWVQVVTFACIAAVAVFARGMWQKLMIVIGLVAATLVYFVLANGLGLGRVMDFGGLASAPWFGLPVLSRPLFDAGAAALIVPVVIILVAENLGHLKAVSAMTGRNLDGYTGRAFIGDGIATMLSAGVGGTGVTTYAENIGVMSATRTYSTAVFPVTAILAIALGFSPKFGALLQLIPVPVMGGASIVILGLIVVAGAKIWIDGRVDFGDNRNVLVAGIAIILGTGDFGLRFAGFVLSGIGTATFGAILLNLLLRRGR